MLEIITNVLATVAGLISQTVSTELAFMAQHPAALTVAVVVLGLLAFTVSRVGAR